MKRLTARDEHGNTYYPKQFKETSNVEEYMKDVCDFAGEVCDKLAAYEDTGLDPEQIREIDRLYSEKCRELAELRKYKRLGTLEELEMLKATHFTGTELIKIAIDLKQLDEYKHIGTLEEVREAVEKQKKKPQAINLCYVCPHCGLVTSLKIKHNHCDACIQHIEWSKEDDR